MRDKTFKQQVEQAQCDNCTVGSYCKELGSKLCSQNKAITDRILAAHNAELDRIAEGMPKPQQIVTRYCAGCDVGCGCSRAGMNCVEPISTEVIKYQLECQTYIQAQKGS